MIEQLTDNVSIQGFGAFTRPIVGELTLGEGRVTFTSTERVGKRTATKVEEMSGRPGLAEALQNGETQTVFEIPLTEIRKSKTKNLGSQLEIATAERKYLFSFYDARQTQSVSSLKGLGAAKKWDEALSAALGGDA